MKKRTALFVGWMIGAMVLSSTVWAAEAAEKTPAAASSSDKSSDKSASAPDDKSTVKLRVVAVNPSKEKPQTVPIKIYLPKEIIPDDIIEMGDLKVGYDSNRGVYYSYSDGVELKPQETRVFEVHLEDVWRVKNEEISKLNDETNLALKHLENTPHFTNAKAIVDSINKRLNEIKTKQEDNTISREEHIGAYRMNLLTMDQIKQDITVLEKMLQTSGGPPSIEFLKDTIFEKKKDIDRITAWKLILAIIALVTVLGVAFYLKWFMALKTRNDQSSGKANQKKTPFISENVEEHVGLSPGAGEETIDVEKLLQPDAKNKRQAG